MPRSVLASALVGIVLVATACGDGDDAVASGSHDLDGRTFLSETITDDGVDQALVPGTTIRIEFTPGQIGVNAGCNQLFGTVDSTADGVLSVSAMGGTEMGCDPERHAQDEWIAGFLTSGPTWELDGDRLVLTKDALEITLLDRVVADPDRSLAGPRWVVDTIFVGEAASSTPEGVEAYLVFDDGVVSGSTGCNELSGSYTIDGGTLRIAELSQTDMGCEPDAKAMEDAVLGALDDAVEFRIEARRLSLVGEDGSGLGLVAAD